MDLETENRIASILMREAAELRRQAEKEGVRGRAYLEKPNVRHRPNSRFLTATVLGVQQANKAVEINEMWRLRSAELEFDERLKRKSREEESSSCRHEQSDKRSFGKRCTLADDNVTTRPSSSRNIHERWQPEDDDDDDDDDEKGLRDVELETFLQSRVKRGRGSIGPRMDETLPCLPKTEQSKTYDTEDRMLMYKSEKSSLLRHETDSSSSSEEEVRKRAHRARKEQKKKKKKLGKKHKSKEKKRDKKKRRHSRD